MAKDVIMFIGDNHEGVEVTAKEAYELFENNDINKSNVRFYCIGTSKDVKCNAEMSPVKRFRKGENEYYLREKNKKHGHIEGCDMARKSKTEKVEVLDKDVNNIDLDDLLEKMLRQRKANKENAAKSNGNITEDVHTIIDEEEEEKYIDIENIFTKPRRVDQIWAILEHAEPEVLLKNGEECWKRVLSEKTRSYYMPDKNNYLAGVTVFKVRKLHGEGTEVGDIINAINTNDIEREHYTLEDVFDDEQRENKFYFLVKFPKDLKKILYSEMFEDILKYDKEAVIIGNCKRLQKENEEVPGEFYIVEIQNKKQMALIKDGMD